MLIQANQIIKEVVDAHHLCTLCCVNTCQPNLLHSVGVMQERISRLSRLSALPVCGHQVLNSAEFERPTQLCLHNLP